MSISWITTFRRGDELGEQFLRQCPRETLAYHDEDLPEAQAFAQFAEGFLTGYANGSRQYQMLKDYRYHAHRFHWKYYAMVKVLDPEYLIWCDADVSFKKPIDERFYDAVLPKEEDVAYLGRKDWDHSECGFMVFNLARAGGNIIHTVHQLYESRHVFTLQQWHDSFIFDEVCRVLGVKRKNLSAEASGRDVWDQTILGEYMTHHKGQLKNAALQGG